MCIAMCTFIRSVRSRAINMRSPADLIININIMVFYECGIEECTRVHAAHTTVWNSHNAPEAC